MTSKEYIKKQAKTLGITIKEYKEGMNDNYVIYDNKYHSAVEFNDGELVVYGGIEDLLNDLHEDDIVMTEAEYVNNFMDLEKKPSFQNISITTKECNGKTYKCLKFAYLLICFSRWGYTCFHHCYDDIKKAVAKGREMKREDLAFSYAVYDWNDLVAKNG